MARRETAKNKTEVSYFEGLSQNGARNSLFKTLFDPESGNGSARNVKPRGIL
jgi:hypothetical protein